MMEQRSKTSISFFIRAALTLLFAVLFALDAVGQNSNEVPHYNLDYIKGGTGYIFIQGWAVDKAYPDRSIGPEFIFYSDAACNNRVWRDGAQLVYRPDVNAQYNTTGDHGFEAAILVNRFSDFQFPEGATEHTFYVRIFVNNTSQKVFEMEGGPFPVTVKKIWGGGTEEDPFLICNSGEWDALADDMADDIIGDFYTDKFYELASEDWCEYDNTTAVTKMFGIRPFTGHFDGNGKTLNVSLSGDAITAPFITTNGATIQNLTVSGTINTVNVAGGIVGYDIGGGTLTLRNCVCSATISGFGHYAGGLVGTCGDLMLNLRNCLFKGSFTPRDNGKYHPIACKNAAATVKVRNTANLFYMNTVSPSNGLGDNIIIGAEGIPVSIEYVPGKWDEEVRVADSQIYYGPHFTGKRLPYLYGFENNDLIAEGWTLLSAEGVNHPEFMDTNLLSHEGSYSFSFGAFLPTCLITPELYYYSPITISFYYKRRVQSDLSVLQVGYSTTTNDIEAFTWDLEIIMEKDDYHNDLEIPYNHYERTFPQGTRYIAIRTTNSSHRWLVDDFSFTACTTPSPASISVSKMTDQDGTLTWEEPDVNNTITGYSYQYKKKSEESWSDESYTTTLSADLSGLSPDTDYDFRVRAHYGEDTSIYLSYVFTTAKELPFEYGFENGLERWSTANLHKWSGVEPKAKRDGENGFLFRTSDQAPQYLISPRLPGTTGTIVSFYYKRWRAVTSMNNVTFQVGYSTTTNDPSAFTWGSELIAGPNWTLYQNAFPAGVQFIAVRYNAIMQDYLLVDDFTFEEYSSYAKPTQLAVSNLTPHGATVTWTAAASATGYAYQYRKLGDKDWTNLVSQAGTTVNLSGLQPNTTYDLRVRALYSDNGRSCYANVRWITENVPISIPCTEGFENGMGGWRMIDCIPDWTGINTSSKRSGEYGFMFYQDLSNYQYLISPLLDCENHDLAISFYYRKANEGLMPVKFRVGYSTTTRDPAAFTWDYENVSIFCNNTEWRRYYINYPVGTRYVAIKVSPECDFFYVDDFSFTTYTPPVIPQQPAASDITATSANLSWTGNADIFDLQYREKALLSDDFENGLGQWKNVHNNIPSNWRLIGTEDLFETNHMAQSTNIVLGYDSNNNVEQVEVLDVDEWLVSPKVKLSGVIDFRAHFYSKSFDASYDKCEVLVSTITDNVPGTFTSIGTIDASTSNSYFELEQYTFSLDSYNGQEGYIAFRHKSRNNSWLILDDISLYRTTVNWTIIPTTEKSIRLNGLEPQTNYEFQVRSIIDNNPSEWTDIITFATVDFKPLVENANNTQTIAALANGQKHHDVILQGHTFYRHRNEWNTLCLPFSLSDFNGTPLEGATVKALSGSDFTDGTLTLNFTEATSIEAGQPYIVQWANGADLLINDNSEWTAFAERVNSGETFAGKNVMLGADISVTTMAGTADHPFCGTFDGNGHTINLYINQPDADYAAPFRYINGATICNVKVTGSINGGDYCSGLVGAALGGTNSIHDCWIAATVTTGGSQIGGILGHGTTSATTIANCYMNGTLSTTNIGVFYGGGSEGGTHTLVNCWATGTYNRGMKGGINLLLADGGTVSVTNCRHDDDDITQGTKVLLITTGDYAYRDFLGSQWTLDGNGRLILKPSSERAAADIENPVFYGVTLSSNAPTSDSFAEGQFSGSYSPIVNTDDWLLDAHNAGNGAFHAAISFNQSSLGSDFVDWYCNTGMTTPATAIPFDADGKVTLYAGWEVELADAADNSSSIDAIIGSGKANNKIVVLNGRTFYHDGNWNTLCVPFSVSNFSGTPLEGATVMKLGSSNLSGSTLTLNFTEVTSIEAGQPYIVKWQDGVNLTINSDADWTAFAQRVASGETFAGKNVLLGADINVSTMVGTADYPFCGTFDGAGHTLNVSIDQTDVDYAAPFRYINGATIRSVKVTGSVKGGDYCAGLVGAALGGTNSIHDCWMAASVDTYGLHIGGIVGHGTTSATTVSNCYQNGSLDATSIGIFYGGGSEGGIHTLEQSWFLGNYSDPIMTGGLDLLIAEGGTVNVTNCRKTTSNDITQGETIIFSNEALVQFLGSQWMLDGNGMAVLKQTTTLLDSEIHNPVFSGVTISSAAPTAVSSQDGRVMFVGNYDPFVIDDSNIDEIIYLGTNNIIGYASAPRTLRAFRAHFVVSAGSTSHAAVRQVLFNDGTTTAVIPIAADVKDAAAEGWYTIQGIKLNGMPTEKGLYIHNGSKVSIK